MVKKIKKVGKKVETEAGSTPIRLQVEATRATRQASFRIEHNLLIAFQDKCSSMSLAQARVIEAMMQAFIDGSIQP